MSHNMELYIRIAEGKLCLFEKSGKKIFSEPFVIQNDRLENVKNALTAVSIYQKTNRILFVEHITEWFDLDKKIPKNRIITNVDGKPFNFPPKKSLDLLEIFDDGNLRLD